MPRSLNDKPLLAYVCLETTESTGGIVYAKTNAQARRIASESFGDGDFHGWIVRRAQEWDHLFPHGPTNEQLFYDGWSFECEYCHMKASNDSGGICVDGHFFCWDHADFYQWRELGPDDEVRDLYTYDRSFPFVWRHVR